MNKQEKAMFEALMEQNRVLMERLSAGSKPAPKAKSTGKEKTAVFMKYNKETGKRDIAKPCTEAQKAAWEAHPYKERTKKTPEELAAYTEAFKWTAKLDKAIKANPSISCKQIHELGGKGCTRELLRDRKVELGVR